MENNTLPNKILVIKDCTFILPDGFDGTLEEAFTEFLKYRAEHLNRAHYVDDSGIFSTFDILVHSKNNPQVCGQYSMYELVGGRYKIVNKSNND